MGYMGEVYQLDNIVEHVCEDIQANSLHSIKFHMTTKQFFAFKNRAIPTPREWAKTYILSETPEGERELSEQELINWQVDRCSYPVIPTRIARQNLDTIDSYEGEF